MRSRTANVLITVLFAIGAATVTGHAADGQEDALKKVVDAAMMPIMEKNSIPGMAIGITVGGKPYLFDYGVTSKETREPVTPDTHFRSRIDQQDLHGDAGILCAGHRPALAVGQDQRLSAIDRRGRAVRRCEPVILGTHTSGGFPLQVPDDVKNNDQLMAYLKRWKPTYKAGTYRTYANPSIGMLGVITAKSMNAGLRRVDGRPIVSGTWADQHLHQCAEGQNGRLCPRLYEEGCSRPDDPRPSFPRKPMA